MAEFIVQIDHPELCVEYGGTNYTDQLERIVRCKDCKYFAEGKKSCWCENDRHDNSCFYPEVNRYGFCAWGKRRDD